MRMLYFKHSRTFSFLSEVDSRQALHWGYLREVWQEVWRRDLLKNPDPVLAQNPRFSIVLNRVITKTAKEGPFYVTQIKSEGKIHYPIED